LQQVQNAECIFNGNYPAANGLAETFKKTIRKLLKKFVSKSQRDWDDKVGECLWAYRTTVRTPTKATPFSLGMGAKPFFH